MAEYQHTISKALLIADRTSPVFENYVLIHTPYYGFEQLDTLPNCPMLPGIIQEGDKSDISDLHEYICRVTLFDHELDVNGWSTFASFMYASAEGDKVKVNVYLQWIGLSGRVIDTFPHVNKFGTFDFDTVMLNRNISYICELHDEGMSDVEVALLFLLQRKLSGRTPALATLNVKA